VTENRKSLYDKVFAVVVDSLAKETKIQRGTITDKTEIPGYGGGIWAVQNVMAKFRIQASFSSWAGFTVGKLTEMVVDVLEGHIINRDGITMLSTA
jgi:hypothetical protein